MAVGGMMEFFDCCCLAMAYRCCWLIVARSRPRIIIASICTRYTKVANMCCWSADCGGDRAMCSIAWLGCSSWHKEYLVCLVEVSCALVFTMNPSTPKSSCFSPFLACQSIVDKFSLSKFRRCPCGLVTFPDEVSF